MLKDLVRALRSIFKGPVRKRAVKKTRQSVRSTTHTRYQSSQKPKRSSSRAASPGQGGASKKKTAARRSAKKYIPSKASAKKNVRSRPVDVRAGQKGAQSQKKSPKIPKPRPELYVGEITHFFAKISVVVLRVDHHPVLIGDEIHVKGSVDFWQTVESLQVESKDVRFARKGELVGLQVREAAKPGDKVFKVKKATQRR